MEVKKSSDGALEQLTTLVDDETGESGVASGTTDPSDAASASADNDASAASISVHGKYPAGAYVKTPLGWVLYSETPTLVSGDTSGLEAALLSIMDVSLSRSQKVAVLQAYDCKNGVYDESLAD